MEILFQQIERIKNKLNQLSEIDSRFVIFGSERHKYKLNQVLSEEEIAEFEETYSVSLPKDYRLYLQYIGNGGAGPYYGIEKLLDSLFEDLDYKKPNDKVNPSRPFPHTSLWNLDSSDFSSHEEYERTYFAKEHSNGILRLCNYGCGVSINLVVNGSEYGNMWADDRGSDNGIIPWVGDNVENNKERLNFLDWYESWLDESLEELKI